MVDQSGFFHVSMLMKYVSSRFQQLPAANLTLCKLQNPHENNRYIIPQQTVKLRVPFSGKATHDFCSSSVAGSLFEQFGIISKGNGYITIVDNLPFPTQTGEITGGFSDLSNLLAGLFQGAPETALSRWVPNGSSRWKAGGAILVLRQGELDGSMMVPLGSLTLRELENQHFLSFSSCFFFLIGKSSLFLMAKF